MCPTARPWWQTLRVQTLAKALPFSLTCCMRHRAVNWASLYREAIVQYTVVHYSARWCECNRNGIITRMHPWYGRDCSDWQWSESLLLMSPRQTLKWTCCHVETKIVTDSTWICGNYNFWLIPWCKFCQNDDISVSVKYTHNRHLYIWE